MRILLPGLLLLASTASAQDLPAPLGASDFPPALSGKDLPRARSPLVAEKTPTPAKPSGKAAAPMVVLVMPWTDADSRAAAASLTRDCASGAWVSRFRRERGAAPRMRLLPTRNRTTVAFLNTALLDRELGAGLRSLAAGSPAAANVVLTSRLLSVNDVAGGKEVQSYLLTLSAIDLASGEKLWVGVHRVRKLVEEVKGKREVRVSTLRLGQPLDLSGSFNDTDADTVSQTLLRDLLASRLLGRASLPVLRFSGVRKRTPEVVSTAFLVALLEHGVHRSGKARIVTSIEEAADLEAELAEGGAAVRPPPASAKLAATHLLTGTLTLLVSAEPAGELRAYSVAFDAVDVARSRKEWLKTASVKKLIARR
jgi:hypothetical protein